MAVHEKCSPSRGLKEQQDIMLIMLQDYSAEIQGTSLQSRFLRTLLLMITGFGLLTIIDSNVVVFTVGGIV